MSLNFGAVGAPTSDPPADLTFMDPYVASEFTCAICMGPPVNARLACYNQHFFCEECLTQACNNKTSCPTCRGELLITGSGYGAKASYVERIVGELMVKCPQGCDASFKFKDMKCHSDVCPEMIQFCPFKDDGCVCAVKRKDMQEHLQSYMTEHIGMQCRSVQESAFDTNEAVDGVRKLVVQSYRNMGQMNLEYMKAILNKQELLENTVKDVETKLSDVYNAVGALTGFLAGNSKSSDDFVDSLKRKAEEMNRVTNTNRMITSMTPPVKKQCMSPAAPGAPGGSYRGTKLVVKLPHLSDNGGLFSRVRVDEADGLDRRNGGSSQANGASHGATSSQHSRSPTSPSYSPSSPQYDPTYGA